MPTLTTTSWDDPDVTALTAAQQVELRARYDGAGEPGMPPSATDVALAVVLLPVEALGHHVDADDPYAVFFARELV